MKTICPICFAALLFLAACSNPADENVFQYDNETFFRIGSEYVSEDRAVTLIIDSIQDSRCPINVECIWQGEITLDLTIKIREEYTARLRSVIHPKDTIQLFEFEVIDATPYPEIGVEIQAEDYRVTLKVSRL